MGLTDQNTSANMLSIVSSDAKIVSFHKKRDEELYFKNNDLKFMYRELCIMNGIRS